MAGKHGDDYEEDDSVVRAKIRRAIAENDMIKQEERKRLLEEFLKNRKIKA